ncbi:MAG TPA: HAMP domain-containing sensor histidine kinase, partial [Elusimicrobiota bacterium]|nr:HAMP domain-containing sensor histidine kinase [Elusimicrobiota bacterium]
MNSAAAFLAGTAAGSVVAGVAAWRMTEERAARYGRLFSFAMHEINTPVTAVNMTIINLLSGVFGEVPPDQVKWIEMTRDQVGRLNGLVGEIRDLVHMELHRELRSSLVAAAPGELIEEALTTLRRGFAHAGVELRVEVTEGLPKVRTDADRAARSLASLLFHARKFRVSGPVTVRAAKRGALVACEIEYGGQRLEPGEAQRSLELFYPARSRKDQILA